MNEAKLKRLLQEYFNDTIDQTDCIELLKYLKNTDLFKIENSISEGLLKLEEGPDLLPVRTQEIWKQIIKDSRYTLTATYKANDNQFSIKFYRRIWFKSAATLLIVFSIGLLISKRQSNQALINKHRVQHEKNDVILPGSVRATLTIDDEKVLELDQTSNGVIVKNKNTLLFKTHNGQIVYNLKSRNQSFVPTSYNTLTTPKGGEYQVVLADGTKVWLNAASSITYPTSFMNKERRIKLSGEAYFEVAKDTHKPFYVITENGEIRVLGTHFNISAYPDDETTSTTLLEGSVLITKHQSSSLLKPGQQANISLQSDNIQVTKANISEVMAWKNGYFTFDEDNIISIMKKVARWYDVDIQYLGPVDYQKFGGTFHRSKAIIELLRYLEKLGNIHFSIVGRRITVTK